MRDKRVFISSVMDGFAEQRAAVKAGVDLLGLRPVMAETFGARPYSSQQACLDGVGESDVVVLVLGRRYGFIARSGKSVTEEEFDFARERGITVLVFLEEAEREAEQEAFVRRISSYEEGYHRVTFTTPDELKDQVIKALNAQVGAGARPTLDAAGAKVALDQLKWGGRRERDRGPWLGAVNIPTRQQQYISPIKLGENSFQRSIQKEAVYGDAAIFGSEHGVKTEETEQSTIFVQSGDRGPIASLEVRTDGTLIYGKLLSATHPRTISIVRNSVIDEDEFKSSLTNFFRFANEVYGLLEDNRMLTAFYFGGSLSGIEHKMFGRIPAVAPNGMSMGMHSFPDPLPLPREPHALSRPNLVDGERAATEITELVARMFRASRAYYTPDEARL